MKKCMFCGGIIDRDCFNPNRCAREAEREEREDRNEDATELEEE